MNKFACLLAKNGYISLVRFMDGSYVCEFQLLLLCQSYWEELAASEMNNDLLNPPTALTEWAFFLYVRDK